MMLLLVFIERCWVCVLTRRVPLFKWSLMGISVSQRKVNLEFIVFSPCTDLGEECLAWLTRSKIL